MPKKKIIQILGPTASGKTKFSLDLAIKLDTEIINVDSMQVYRDLAVGTDKPSDQDRKKITFYGLDLIALGPPMDAAAFADYADKYIEIIWDKGKIPILSGGTGLYHKAIRLGLLEAPSRDDNLREKLRKDRDTLGIEALYKRLKSIDPRGAARIQMNDWIRIERALEYHELTGKCISDAQVEHGFSSERYDSLRLATWRPREELYQKINERLDIMWESGIVEETKMLLDARLDLEQLPLKALGYRQAAQYLLGKLSGSEALDLAKKETRRFAKRQLTWLRADPGIFWLKQPLNSEQWDALLQCIDDFKKGLQTNFSKLNLVKEP